MVKGLEAELQNSEQEKTELVEQYATIQGWADIYDGCDMEVKKMILSQIFSKVLIRRDYEIEIDLTLDYHQLGIEV